MIKSDAAYATADNSVVSWIDEAGRPCSGITATNADVVAYLAGGGTIAAYQAPPPDYVGLVKAALIVSDHVFIRCGKAGVAWPSAWQTYVVALRAIVDGTAQGPLPAMPAYPAGP